MPAKGPGEPSADRRGGDRHRTRLRTGKIADGAGRFIVECIVYDRSVEGARLRPIGDIVVPDGICLYDDEHGTLVAALVTWRRGSELGIAFAAERNPPDLDALSRRLGGKYYAI
jgi:hypothetical protein